ncbi:putative small heat shock protein HSP20 [Rosa chinensis]|uniref:Putative small heat shock protein HSP20 n=1 Tax=Rosa chinensis TaxID=74649 RepID=A0A2P6R457_ROSCH|nr:putative small heat shock protein HSP20 [Rosa chinensis]
MSLIPGSFFGNGRRSNIFDPFSLDIWDPFQDFPLINSRWAPSSETAAVANTRIDWKETPEAHVDKWHRLERSSGKFLRRFRLPENAKVEQVNAAMENGVLTVTVPKVEVKKPDVKAIQISD